MKAVCITLDVIPQTPWVIVFKSLAPHLQPDTENLGDRLQGPVGDGVVAGLEAWSLLGPPGWEHSEHTRLWARGAGGGDLYHMNQNMRLLTVVSLHTKIRGPVHGTLFSQDSDLRQYLYGNENEKLFPS